MAFNRIVVFGDSILWGQGLNDDHKLTSLVRRQLAADQGSPVDLVSFAHSGADVWDDGETDLDDLNPIPAPLPPLGGIPPEAVRNATKPSPDPAERRRIGELPREKPYTLREVDKAVQELSNQTVDLILLDAGINDVNVPNIVLPFKSRGALEVRTQSVKDRLTVLMEHVHNSFPQAKIVVTGYYRIVTEFSDVEKLLRYAAHYLHLTPEYQRRNFNVSAHEGPLFGVAAILENDRQILDRVIGGQKLERHLIGPFKERMVELSAIFADTVHWVMTDVVGGFNATNQPHAAIAIPDIPPQHAAFSPSPWIWGLDQQLEPEDEVASERKALADQEDRFNPLQEFIDDRASLGHPNALGAQAYAKAIRSVLP